MAVDVRFAGVVLVEKYAISVAHRLIRTPFVQPVAFGLVQVVLADERLQNTLCCFTLALRRGFFAGGGSLYRHGAQKRYGLFKAQILDELGEVYGAAAFGVARETVEAAVGGVAERCGILLWPVNRTGSIPLLAVLALLVVADVQPERGGQGGERERADLLVLV